VTGVQTCALPISSQPRDDEQHPAESLLRLYLQRPRNSNRSRRTLPVFRLASQSDDRRRRNEPEFCLSRCERASASRRKAINQHSENSYLTLDMTPRCRERKKRTGMINNYSASW